MRQDIEQTAVQMLAGREHSREELRRKLCQRAFDPDAVDRVLDGMIASGLISDERFAEQYVHSSRKRGRGPVRIGAELRDLGVSDELIERWLVGDSEEWRDLLYAVHAKKFGPELPRDMKDMARRVRFLRYRGFDGEQIRRFLWQKDSA